MGRLEHYVQNISTKEKEAGANPRLFSEKKDSRRP